MKNREVIDRILAYHPYLEGYEGCDEFKAGNPEKECRGIACALVPTVEVLKKCAELGCNLLLVHEPLYYQTPDFPAWRGNFENEVQKEKEALIREYGITIWRDHDHMHAHNPDSIFTGVIHYLGWDDYYVGDESTSRRFYFPIVLPETTVGELGRHLMETLHLNGLRYLGRAEDKISKVAIVGHLYPNSFGEEGIQPDGSYTEFGTKVMELMEKEGIQVILPGEIIEWTVLAYIRDAIALGKVKACMNLGHFNFEELGMRYMADWLPDLVDHSLPVSYIPTGDMYSFL